MTLALVTIASSPIWRCLRVGDLEWQKRLLNRMHPHSLMQNITSGQTLDYPILIIRTDSISQYMEQGKEVGTPRWFGVSFQVCSTIAMTFAPNQRVIAAQTGQTNAKYQWSVSSTIATAKSTPSMKTSLQVPFKLWWEKQELTPMNGPYYCKLLAAP